MFTLPGQTMVQRKRWTVMLYIAADHPQPERAAITERAAIRDLRELESVGSTDDLDILVQIDRRWPGYPERYWIKKARKGEGRSQPCGTLVGTKNINDSGDPGPLIDFLKWAREEHPADNSMLVLWGHAYGLGFGRDHGDPLTIPELAKALKTEKGYEIDILGANACAMCYAEAAYELRNAASFLVAPEITMPFAGWPYDRILKRIAKSAIEPRQLAQDIVTDFVDSFGRQDVSLTLLDLTKAEPLGEGMKALASAVEHGIGRKKTGEPIGDAFLDTAHGSVRPLIDLVDLCGRLACVDDSPIESAAKAMKEFLEPGDDKFVIKYEGDTDLEGLHGLGIFAPAVTGAADLTRLELSEPHYKALELVKYGDNPWAKLVYHDLRRALDPMNKAVAEFVKTTGATGVEQRMGVAQLMVSIHRAFAKLDKTLTTTQEKVIGTVANGNGAAPGRHALPAAPSVAGKQFGPPYLRLASDYRQPQFRQVKAIAEGVVGGTTVIDATEDNRLLQMVAPLAELEDALANVERITKRVLTDRKFGLGAGDEPPFKTGMGAGDEPPFKTGMGAGDEPPFKTGMGAGDEPPFKTGMGTGDEPPIKTGMGILPWLDAADMGIGAFTNPIRTVAGLYRQVAQALQLSEEAVAKIEGLVRSLLANGSIPQDVEYKQRGIEQVQRSFRELKEMVAQAKRTTGWVLTHPAYGLGPSPQTAQGTVPREQLAMVGGLSSRVLRLM